MRWPYARYTTARTGKCACKCNAVVFSSDHGNHALQPGGAISSSGNAEVGGAGGDVPGVIGEFYDAVEKAASPHQNPRRRRAGKSGFPSGGGG